MTLHRDSADPADDLIGRLVEFARTIEHHSLEVLGDPDQTMRVVRVPRPHGAASLIRDGSADEEVVAEALAPAVLGGLAVWNAAHRPDWTWTLKAVEGERPLRLGTEVSRLAHRVREAPAECLAFAERAEAELNALFEEAGVFELISNHPLTCCGGTTYVLELPTDWALVQFYAYC